MHSSNKMYKITYLTNALRVPSVRDPIRPPTWIISDIIKYISIKCYMGYAIMVVESKYIIFLTWAEGKH
jgi:hypothetical protein